MTGNRPPAGDRDRTRDQQRRRTPLSGDDRGVSEVLGAVLIFGLVILLLSLIQLNAVPAANQQIEFEHNQRVQGDMQELQEVLSRTAATDIEGTVKIEAGTGYPTRFFLFNPPRATGSLDLSDAGTATLSNARATGEAGHYLDGSARSFTTRSLSYRPNYNEYRNAPTTIYENGVLYNQYENNQSVVQERGALVSGRRISLVALQGNLSVASSHAVSLDVTPISGPARSVSVTDSGTPMTLTVPTRLSVDEWSEILVDERATNGGHVTDVRAGPTDGTVTLELEQGVTYDLRLAALGVGSGFERSTPPQYLVDADGNGTLVPEGGTQQLVVEVRDAYNNPVSNVTVDATASTGTVTAVGTDQSDSEGEVTFAYEAPTQVNGQTPVTVTAYFNGSTPRAQRELDFSLGVVDSDSSGGGGGTGVNPSNSQSVALRNAELVVGTPCTNRNKNCAVDLTFENLDEDAGRSVSQMRVGFYSAQGDAPPNTFSIAASNGTVSSGTVGGSFENVSLDPLAAAGEGAGDDQQTYRVSFDFTGNADGIQSGDFFATEVIFKNDVGAESVATYFVAPS